MLRSPLRADLSLIDEGIAVGLEFGAHSIIGLARLGELLLHSVYEPGSLRRAGDRVEFILRNPPLRMGSFGAVRVLWDQAPLPPSDVSVETPGTPERTLDSVGRERPLTIPVGQRTRFALRRVAVDDRRHQVRLELQSVAIPPRVWYEFSDVVRPELP